MYNYTLNSNFNQINIGKGIPPYLACTFPYIMIKY